MAISDLCLPYDPMIDVIARDIKTSRAFQQAVKSVRQCVVPYRNTLHPSDELLEAWYRFKENQICQR